MTRMSFLTRRLASILCLMAAFALAGCKEVLYSDLSETEANEMVAVLAAGGISASRERDKSGVYALSVDGEQIADAVVVLRRAGYPKQRFQSLGEVFGESGLVGTPFEERARYMFALNEELSRTISEINGIHSARVQVMIPETEKFVQTQTTASASVAILVEPGVDVTPLVPSIKSLVSHSVPNLDYERVSVALFPVDAPTIELLPGAQAPATGATTMGLGWSGLSSSGRNAILVVFLIGAFCALMVLAIRSGRSSS